MREESFICYWLRTSAGAQIALMLMLIVGMTAGAVTLLDALDGRPASLPAAVAAFVQTLDGGTLACR